MKTLLLTAALLTATGAVAALADEAAMPTAPAVALSPYDAKMQTARAQFEAEDFVGVQKTIEAALALAQTPKEKSDALRRLGYALNEQKKYAEAREIWQKALPLVKDSPDYSSELRTRIASSYNDEELWPQAAAAFSEIVNDPSAEDKSLQRLALATVYSKLKQPDKAREQLVIVMADPTLAAQIRVGARFLLSQNYKDANQPDQAREQLAIVVADPTIPAGIRGLAQISIGQIYLDESNFDEARRSVEAAEKIPDVPSDLLISTKGLLGEIAKKQNRPEEAEAAFAQQRALLMLKAVFQANAKDFEGAIESYQAAISAGVIEMSLELALRLQIGIALEKLGKYEEARDEFQRVLDADPFLLDAAQNRMENPAKIGAYLGLARVDIAEKKFDSARETLNRALQIPDLEEDSATKVEALLNSLPPKADAPAQN